MDKLKTMYTIHPLAVGFNETDQGIMTYRTPMVSK